VHLKESLQRFFYKVKRSFRIFNTNIISHSRIIIKNIIIILFIFIAILLLVSLLTFQIIRKGPPETVVPKVAGKDLVEGLIILQKKNLRAIIDPRYFSDNPKNIIVEQEPKAGSVVKERKDIKLIVSKGSIVSIVEDYTDRTLSFVQNRLQEIFSFQGKTIRIGNIAYVTSDKHKGIIVGQYPPPDTPITNVDKIDLIISKGQEIQALMIKDYTGENISDVMESLALQGVLVNIITEETVDPSQNGIIISQDPQVGSVVNSNDTVTFHVGYLPSEKEKDKLYARVFNFVVPADIKNATIRIVVKDRIGEREIYNAENRGKDSISIPFKSYSNTTVYVYINDSVYELRKYK